MSASTAESLSPTVLRRRILKPRTAAQRYRGGPDRTWDEPADQQAENVAFVKTAVQNHYNLSERTSEDVVDYCAGEGIVFVPYFPLHGDGSPALAEIAERRGATRAQITLAWLLKRSPTMLPIPGTLSLAHLIENLAALEIELGEDQFQALE